jgi:GTP-binding protein
VTPADRHFAQWLRRTGRPVILVANKAESRAVQGGLGEAYALGLGDPVAISAQHGEGMGELYERLLPFAPAQEDDEEPNPPEEQSAKPLQLAIVQGSAPLAWLATRQRPCQRRERSDRLGPSRLGNSHT